MKFKLTHQLLMISVLSVSMGQTAFATNGMNLEGYGPIATGVGGASMAYDNGTAAMMNNPATLGMMKDGKHLDVAIGVLGPNVNNSMSGMPDAKSSANSFFMPAIGFVTKSNKLIYGFGVFAQGGMGTQYSGNSFMSAGSGKTTRSEVSVGRAMVPIVYNPMKNLSIGGTLDFVWVGMDLQMAMDVSTINDMMNGSQAGGKISPSNVLSTIYNTGDWAYFDFSNSSPLTGEASALGYSGKLGAVYKVNSELSLGATYHFETALGDLNTNNASVTTGTVSGTQTINGKISVKNFQWPSMYAIGAAYKPLPKLMLVADIKQINWSRVMKSFKMTFDGMDVELYQKWSDQTVYSVGAMYQVLPALMLRAGLNRGNNPVPDQYLNALFPAIEHNHLTLGGGYMFNKSSDVNLSMTYAPEYKPYNPGTHIATSMSQINWQAMYSYAF